MKLIFSLKQLGSSENSEELQQAILPTTIINDVRSKGNQNQLKTNIDTAVELSKGYCQIKRIINFR